MSEAVVNFDVADLPRGKLGITTTAAASSKAKTRETPPPDSPASAGEMPDDPNLHCNAMALNLKASSGRGSDRPRNALGHDLIPFPANSELIAKTAEAVRHALEDMRVGGYSVGSSPSSSSVSMSEQMVR